MLIARYGQQAVAQALGLGVGEQQSLGPDAEVVCEAHERL
jgi:hypothetical protein